MKKMSLKMKLVSTNVMIALLMAVLSFTVVQYIFSKQKAAALDELTSFSKSLSNALGAQFFERYGDVQAFSINPSIRSSNKGKIVDTLNTYAAMYGIYDLIMVVDAKGNLVAVNDKSPAGAGISVQSLYQKNYANEEWFKNAISGRFTEDKEKNFLGTFFESIQVDPYVAEVYKNTDVGTSFTAQIKDESGKVIGVISNRTSEIWFGDTVRQVYDSMLGSGFHAPGIQLVNKDGYVIYQYEPKDEKSMKNYVQNRDILFKQRLLDSNKFVKTALAGGSGAGFEVDSEEKTEHAYGYTLTQGKKFIDSIGWGILVGDPEEDLFSNIYATMKIFYASFFAALLMAVIVGVKLSSGLAKKLSGYAERLSYGAAEVFKASSEISTSSTELSEASTEQAAAIQETAASIDQVSAMVKKNSENASHSLKRSGDSKENATVGQTQIQNMVSAINDISQSNAKIMNQVEDGNKQISEIVKVIAEIGNKTKVINDIVFQTKLLSFNASVEAARAGEHGKGFAVVAEEVGSLAQMSGNAAKEISAMLDSSIQKVEQIVSDTRSKVETLIVDGKAKVEVGKDVAVKCSQSLGKILDSVQEVDSMITEITEASKEQSQGVSEINKAINQLDQVTHKNTSIAQKTESSAGSLNMQSSQLKNIVEELMAMVEGEKGGSQAAGEAFTKAEYSQSDSQKPPSNSSRDAQSSGKAQVIALASAKKAPHRPELAKAVGSTEVPASNDPRFEEV